jgi:hypothetical protein
VTPIRLETGRYENINLEERCCFNCSNLNEDEMNSEYNLNLYRKGYCSERPHFQVP